MFSSKDEFCETNNGDIALKFDCSVNDPATIDGIKEECESANECCMNVCLTENPLGENDVMCKNDTPNFTRVSQ